MTAPMPDEALIERMAEAYYYATWGPMPSWVNAGEYDKGVARRGVRAAYEVLADERARYEVLLPVLKRAKGVIEHGVEMVGPEPYEFTKDEVIEVAAQAIDSALAALEGGTE